MWLAFVLAAASPVPILSTTFPVDVPSGAVIAGWARVHGDAEARTGTRIAYELFIDPKRLALYMITRYRVHSAGKGEPENEILIWNAKPGARPPQIHCYQRVRRPDAAEQDWRWESVPSGTEPYRQALYLAVEVYVLQNERERRDREKAEGP